MELRQLEYFVRVAELGGFTRASIALNVAQSALSRQVRELELELCQSLLVRNGRGVVATEAGKVLLEHARGILHQVARTREELGRVRGALAGRVAIGLPPRFAKMLTVPLTRAVRERLPEAVLAISEGLSTALQESLVSGRLDIALLYNPVPSPDLDSRVLFDEDFYLVMPRRRRPVRTAITLDELADEPLIIPTRPNTIRMLVEAELAHIGRHPRIAMEIDGIAAILDLVAEDMGSAVLSVDAVRASGREDILYAVPIVRPRLRSKLALAVSAQRPATRTQQAVQDIITELVGPRGA
ncbi:HTH-type transcriptional regulator CynR [Pigmentiphaga humi]|uniref:HTH-type transcriptional regulator CynR n=1 Tax=Pigmentiphaga humi TaxID=2478468 RepID=A0A3P4B110_9BURK|nr:LysR substrate-binding domain-containing protein [Pigmentiphaga humi]VCU69420.1 HTH-type transcriptional regulator CynR [Pigmentiphaga humi]